MAGSGCGRRAASPSEGGPIVVVGVDGASWSVLSPMLEQGRLPRLAGLYRAGSAGLMRSVEPMVTAPMWTTLATGRPASVHGIRTNAVRIPGTYTLRPVTADQRRSPAIWSIASHHDAAVGVVGWPVGFPAEPVRGFVISAAWNAASGEPPRGIYPDGALDPEGSTGEALDVPDRLAGVASFDADLGEAFERDLADLSRGLSLTRVYQPRILLLRFSSIDSASHRYWQFLDPGHVERLRARGETIAPDDAGHAGQMVPAAYEFLDAWVGMLMDRIPEHSTIVIVSNHGFRAANEEERARLDPDRLLRALGYLRIGAGGTPDWSETIAFTLPADDGPLRGIYLNVEGREREGSVPAGDLERLRVEISGTLRSIATRDNRTFMEEVSLPEARADVEPDLWIAERGGIDDAEELVHAGNSPEPLTAGDLRRPRTDMGRHDINGIILAAGAGIARGRTGFSADLVDVTPTLLHLAGIPVAADLPGELIVPMLDDPPSDLTRSIKGYPGLRPAPDPVMLPAEFAAREIEALRRASHLF